MPQPKRSRKGTAATSETPEELREQLQALRDRLLQSVTLSTDRLQEAVDDAVRRGRMTRHDAEELVSGLVSAGRTQTEQLLADLERLLPPGVATGARRATAPARTVVDRARRAVGGSDGAGRFPIDDYDDLTAAQITGRLKELDPAQLRAVRDYEKRNANRKSVLAAVDKALA
ncbi:hypothetical protein [Conexibacter sp. SYSU D00693]|uniref:hypothetical protein n=1 Tax=Conexibacter sp. SYSU D00693 TaxID=2812560 RepID=UPI00196ACA69|nr:hypothetical protein [Conexibacter sp. SYSU D00693]